MKDFDQFKEFCAKQQRKYIAAERDRMAKARSLASDPLRARTDWTRLELWPMTHDEIDARLLELDHMETEIPERFGDTDTMRWSFQRYQGLEAVAIP